ALGDAHPVGQFEQIALWCALAPIAEASFASRAVFNEGQSGKPTGHSEDEFYRNALGGRQIHDAVGVGIVAERRGKRHFDPGACQVARRVERIAAAGERKSAFGAARQFDEHFADANRAPLLLGHDLASRLGTRLPRLRKKPSALSMAAKKMTGQSV